MKISLLKYFAWISLLLIALTSCRSARVTGPGGNDALPGNSINAGQVEKVVFKTIIIWGERELSGQMLVKSTDDGNVRVAFYNEIGMTYLEGTLDRSSKHQKLIVQNIAPLINYKPFIKNFEKCLQEIGEPVYFFDPTDILTGSVKNPVTVELRNGFKMELTTTND